jgi:hypothetical protein
MTALLVVNVRDALPSAMPWIMAEPFSYSYTEMAVSGLPLVLLVSFALTARITRQRPALQAANEAEDLGRQNDSLVMPVCWHERPVLLVCSSLMALVYALIEIKSSINWVFASNQTMSWRDALDWAIGQPGLVFELLFLIDPYMPGNVCLVFLTVMGFGLVLAWRGRKKRMPKFSVSLPRYGSAGGFLFVFLLITLLVILGALQLCLTGFMIDATDLVL